MMSGVEQKSLCAVVLLAAACGGWVLFRDDGGARLDLGQSPATGPAAEIATKAGAPADARRTAPVTVSQPPREPVEELAVDEMAGFPVPKRHRTAAADESPFRRELEASVPADFEDVLAFYRRELAGRGWKEKKRRAILAADRAQLAFRSPEGPAVLELRRKDGETLIRLELRNRAEAQRAGVLPKPGRARLLLGNALTDDAVVTVDERSFKITAGVGSKRPDGPTLDLTPGKHRYALTAAGHAAQNEEVEVGAGETWGLLIGPSGALALHLY